MASYPADIFEARFMIHFRGLILLLLLAIPLATAQTVVRDASITFTTIDVPGAGYTGVWGINSVGDVVGNYGQDTNTDSHGFLLHSGSNLSLGCQ